MPEKRKKTMEISTQVLGSEEIPNTPGSAAKLIGELKGETRRPFSADNKMPILLEGIRKEIPISGLCRR
jgi:hypothetical protein